MQVIVTVKERYPATRQVIGHDLSGEYIIHLPGDLEPDSAEKEAIEICRELLSIEGNTWFELTGRLASG